jgi:hypothetical protein
MIAAVALAVVAAKTAPEEHRAAAKVKAAAPQVTRMIHC